MMSSDPATSSGSPTCPLCNQSTSVDSLTGRCIRCHPIQLSELSPELQSYAREAESERYRNFLLGLVMTPILIGGYFFLVFTEADVPGWVLGLLVISTPVLLGMSIYTWVRKRSLRQRYYRLPYVMQQVAPIQAELQYKAKDKRRYFEVCQLAPGSSWPAGVAQKLEIDIPPKSDREAVTNDFWEKLIAGYDPHDHPKIWGHIYFDPDHSGSALICVEDRVFVSVSENNKAL